MIERRSWKEFQEAGLVWWVNRVLHLFGWAIVVEPDGEDVYDVYPARCKFRGFTEDVEDRGFRKLTKHIQDNTDRLMEDLDT